MASSKRSGKKIQRVNLSPIFNLVISLLLIIFGAGFLIYPQLQKLDLSVASSKLASLQKESASAANLPARPFKLYIPKIAKILYVSDGYVVDNRWSISETGVSYLTSSAAPGQIGNSVIYGHNRNDILGYLPKVTTGDPIFVVLANGDYVKYEVAETKVIEPTQVEILDQTHDSRLTIYTCTGFLDTARFVVVAKQIDKLI